MNRIFTLNPTMADPMVRFKVEHSAAGMQYGDQAYHCDGHVIPTYMRGPRAPKRHALGSAFRCAETEM